MQPRGRFGGRAWAAGVCVALAIAGCGDSPVAPDPAPTHTVSGTVTEMTTEGRAPVEGALVTHLATGKSTRTDVSGGYSIAGVPARMATISVSKEGFSGTTAVVDVTGDARLDLQLVRLPPPPPPPQPAVLTGLVYEQTPTGPVPVADVWLENSYIHAGTLTGADGRYRLEFTAGLGPFDGFVSLFVTKDGYRPVTRELRVNGETRLDIEIVRR